MLDAASKFGTHYPADPTKFQFDDEVAAIFDDMSVRSIPNFLQAHAAHAAMLRPWLKHDGCKVLDVGASRGAFFRAIINEVGMEPVTNRRLLLTAIDSSQPMVERMFQEFPYVSVKQQDITHADFATDPSTYDVVCVNYVLQFIPKNLQLPALRCLVRKVRSGGVMIIGHKSASPGESGELAHEEYIKWRMGNGYSREEIEAKTSALKGSMFPMSHEEVMAGMRFNFSEVTETFRFMMFSTLFAVK